MSDRDRNDTNRNDANANATNRDDANRNDPTRGGTGRIDASDTETSSVGANLGEGREHAGASSSRAGSDRGAMRGGRHDEDGGDRYDTGHYGGREGRDREFGERQQGRSEGRMNRDRYGGRQDGGRYDTGRFGSDFYEGGRHVGMGGRYEADRYEAEYDEGRGMGGGMGGGYGRGRQGGAWDSGYAGAYDAGYGGGQGGYGGGFQGSYGGMGGGYGDRMGGQGDFRMAGRGYGGYGAYGGGYGSYGDYGGRDYGQQDYGSYRVSSRDRDDEGGGSRAWLMAAGAAALAVAGGFALFRSATGDKHDRQGRSRWKGIHVEESVTINKPASEIYRHWHDLENLGEILSHVEKVEKLPNGRSKWTVKGPAGTKVEWEAETVQDRTNERITWRSVPGADVPNEGSVWFQERSGGRGTEVHVSLMYHPPGGALGAGLASLFGEEPHQQIAEDLRRFKRRMESGQIVSEGHKSPSARTSGNA